MSLVSLFGAAPFVDGSCYQVELVEDAECWQNRHAHDADMLICPCIECVCACLCTSVCVCVRLCASVCCVCARVPLGSRATNDQLIAGQISSSANSAVGGADLKISVELRPIRAAERQD